MASPSVKFEISFYESASPQTITFRDITDYSAVGMTAADVRGLIWCVDPNGTTFYKNAGYDTDDFISAPDINPGNGSKAGIALSLDSSGNVLLGTYTFYMKVKDVVGGVTVYSGTKTHNYQYEIPTCVINLSYSARESTLTSTDATTYTVNGISYTTMTRAHHITIPTGSGANDPGSVTDSGASPTRTIGGGGTPATRLWTRIWVTDLSVILHYEMETWSGATWIHVYDTMTGSDSVDVQVEDYIADLQTYLSALYDRWVTAKGNDTKEANRLSNVIVQILTTWQEYENASRIDDGDPATYAGEIAALLNVEGYVTGSGSDAASVVVVPWGASVGGGGSTFNFQVGINAPTGGNWGDLGFETGAVPATEMVLWKNIGGVWTSQGDTFGADGADGADYNPILFNSLKDALSPASGNVEALKTYAMPANTLDGAYDEIEIEALYYVAAAINETKIRIMQDSNYIGYLTEKTVNPQHYKLRARLVMLTATTAFYESYVDKLSNIGSSVPSPSPITTTYGWSGLLSAGIDFTGVMNIKATCHRIGSFPNLGDVICKYMRVRQSLKA